MMLSDALDQTLYNLNLFTAIENVLSHSPSTMSFNTIPVLDISLAKTSETKPAFLDFLRNALLDVGFLYIKNTGINDGLIEDVITQGKAFFELPESKKLEIQMKNKPSFLGTSPNSQCL